jgi:CheY-like chemotaxis protein
MIAAFLGEILTEAMSITELSILIVGETSRAEFREARRSLACQGRLMEAENLADAVTLLEKGTAIPDVVVIAQSYPGQFSLPAIDDLRRRVPLARMLALLGSWCEGETRTGRPWPAAIRLYWHQWQPHAEREFHRLGEGLGSSWSLPMTASEEEHFLALAEQPLERREGTVAIWSSSFEMQDWLSDACRRVGCQSVWFRGGEKSTPGEFHVAIFDAVDCSARTLSELRALANALRPTPVIALLDFPRVEDRDQALSAGASAILSKPVQLEDLFWQIDRLTIA